MIPWPVSQALLTAFSFITFVLVSVPLYWHLEAWNVGCVLYIAWVGPQCLIQFINGVLWRDNAINWAPVWCDITVRYTWGASHGLLAASLVINRRLYKIATTSSVSITRSEKRRTILVDLAIGLSIPILHIILLWFVQGHRFDIFAGVGCLVAVPNTYFAIVLSNGLAIVIGLISAAYCGGTIRAFMKRRRQFSELLASNNNLTFHRYLRLMALAAIELISTVPLATYLMVRQLRSPIYQWKGLGDLHWGFSAVHQYPSIVWLETPGNVTFLTMEPWLYITCGLIFFLFFGLAEEARTHYRLAFTTVAKKLGYTSGPSATSGFSSGLPPYVISHRTSLRTTLTFIPSHLPRSKGSGSKLGISITIPSFIQRSANRRGSIFVLER
ncbi:hypothetical protein NM688_g1519 [Phlebia brevispora]|uniref:Uncharacterized protein n=1 Tax=Phlebia brevispora TaxID=194682 RepID=A0ACC1TB84_9APHY|nr:hypothetical protein NM688_g1519 [Phlebia brevispora]